MWIDKESEYQIHIFFSAMTADIVKKRKTLVLRKQLYIKVNILLYEHAAFLLNAIVIR